jgi:hypothetical protein
MSFDLLSILSSLEQVTGQQEHIEKYAGKEGLFFLIDILTQMYHFQHGFLLYILKATKGTEYESDVKPIHEKIGITLKSLDQVITHVEGLKLNEEEAESLEYHKLNVEAKLEVWEELRQKLV